ncbi:MAG: T9SS type A sorting domain-containing protein, partial [Bacteroidota bacterium]
PNVTVTLNDGTADVATEVTDASGRADFSDSGLDLTQFYDIRLERDSLARTYQAVRPSELGDTTLVLPATLTHALEDELVGLDTTHTLVLGYDTDAARQLVTDWTGTPQPELTAVHRDRDLALARLVIAAEGLAEVYRAVEPLSNETAGVTIDAFTGLLAFRKTLQELETAANGVVQGTSSVTQASLAQQLIFAAASAGLSLFETTYTDAAQAVLPPWAATLFVKSEQVAISVTNDAFSSAEWNTADARKGLLGQAFGIGRKIAGQSVLASGYVLVTDTDLGVATAQARQLAGLGTPIEAFQASQGHVLTTTASIDQTLNESELFSSTLGGWSTAADLAILVGTVPAMQLAAAIGGGIKAFNTGGLVVVTVADLYELYDVAFEEAPLVAARAFDPSATASVVFVDAEPTPARRQAARARQVAIDAYLDRIASIVAKIEAGDRDGAIVEAEALLADDEALREAFETERLRLIGLAEQALAQDDDGGNQTAQRLARGPFADAFTNSTTASTGLISEQMSFYAALAAYVVPELTLPPDGSSAPPFAATDSLLAIAPRLSAAVTTASSAMETALGLTDGLVADALVMLPEHGLPDPAGRSGWTAPDQQIPFQARVVNAGEVAAEGVEVRLVIDGDTTGGDPAMRVISERVQTLSELASGAEETLTWWVATRDTSAAGTGSAATYELVTTATSGRARGAVGGIEVTSEAPVSEEAPAEPVAEVGLRVYPNPTRSASSVQVDLPEPARIRLSVYDALGREVAVALDADRPAGRHTVALAVDGLATGVYVVRLVADGAARTQRLTVVR